MLRIHAVLVALLAASLAVAITPAEAAPICGPYSGNQIVKSRTCVNPDYAPSCPVYTEYWQSGGHYWYMCYGVSVPGNPTTWTVEDLLELALEAANDRLPICPSYGNQPVHVRACISPFESCLIDLTVEVVNRETRGCF